MFFCFTVIKAYFSRREDRTQIFKLCWPHLSLVSIEIHYVMWTSLCPPACVNISRGLCAVFPSNCFMLLGCPVATPTWTLSWQFSFPCIPLLPHSFFSQPLPCHHFIPSSQQSSTKNNGNHHVKFQRNTGCLCLPILFFSL